jgi:hypothetical protein
MPVYGSNINVIGNKLQGHNDNTLYGFAKRNDEHFHAKSEVYPELANPIQLQKDSGAWAAYPATKTEIISAGQIDKDFDIHWISVSGISANGNYTVKLYSGLAGAEIEIGTVDFTRNAIQSQEGAQPNQDVILSAGTRVSAGLSSGNAAQDTCNIKLRYHKY